MNAGSVGERPGLRHAQLRRLFHLDSGARLAAPAPHKADRRSVFERIVKQVSDIKAEGRKFGREIEVYHAGPGDLPADATRGRGLPSPCQCRKRGLGRHRPDAGAQEHHAAKHASGRICGEALDEAVSGIGGYPFVGTPDKVAAEFADICHAGVRGIAVSFVNYVEEMPYFCAEVLPRLSAWGSEQISGTCGKRIIARRTGRSECSAVVE